MILHSFYRSSASYRVRIALSLKGLDAEYAAQHLTKGAQHSPEFRRLNPQGLVPALVTDGGGVLTQSLAIIEWLDETHPYPALLPSEPILRARVRAFAYAIACDIHPLQNLRVLQRLQHKEGLSQERAFAWARAITEEGLDACEELAAAADTPFCFTDAPSLADLCLIPQMVNARRYGADSKRWKRLSAVESACMALPAFIDAAPERQPDAE
jgi:maleylpyruvate isomerase